MNVVGKRGLQKLIAKHPRAEEQLLAWYKVAKSAHWSSLNDVRHQFPSADMVGMVLIFDILHNDFRLITVASWRSKRVYVKALLTHAEYDRKGWMKWV